LPNVKSAEKRMRTSKIRAQRNKQARSRLRTAIKKVGQTDTPDAAVEAQREAVSLIDRAAAKRLIHPNRAGRLKSQLAGLVQSKQPAGA
jgi:small subunit ribosomal protein S20